MSGLARVGIVAILVATAGWVGAVAWLSTVMASGQAGQGQETWFCPMHPAVTSTEPRKCSVCGMALVVGNPLDTQEYELDVSTVPAAVKAGETFTIRLTALDPVKQSVVSSFEEVHDKRYHLFIISSDMSVFEHVHPQMQANGTWQLETRLPKPGYYTVLSDFMPTGGAPQLIRRTLITADFDGDAESAPPNLVPDKVLTKTADSITATVDFNPETLRPGDHGHLVFSLADSSTGEPVTDLQPYLGAFGHTLIMSEERGETIHSHPIPGPESDITRGHGGPRVTFEGFFPRAGNYRAWTQLLRGDKLSTFTFTFRVQAFGEAGDPRITINR